jgi:hypothetical protein
MAKAIIFDPIFIIRKKKFTSIKEESTASLEQGGKGKGKERLMGGATLISGLRDGAMGIWFRCWSRSPAQKCARCGLIL